MPVTIVDELITRIGFDLSPSAKAALGATEKAFGRIAGAIKSLGIVSGIASGTMAALTIAAGREATDIRRLSASTGVAIEDVQALQSVYKQLGGSAQQYASDAERFRLTTRKVLNTENLKEYARRFSGMSKQMIIDLLRASGFSDTMAHAIALSADELGRMATEAKNFGASASSLQNLQELEAQWNKTKDTISGLSLDVQGEFAPAIKDGLTWLQQFLVDHKDEIVGGARAIAEGMRGLFNALRELFAWLEDNPLAAELIGGVALSLGAYAAISIPASLIAKVASLTGALTGLTGASTGLAGAIGAGGPLLLAFAALSTAAYIYRDELGAILEGVTQRVDGFIRKANEFKAAAKDMAAKERRENLEELESNHLGASARNAASTLYDTVATAVTTGKVDRTVDALTAGLQKQMKMNIALGGAIREEVSARAGEEVAGKMDEIIGNVGWHRASSTARTYAEIIAEGELAKREDLLNPSALLGAEAFPLDSLARAIYGVPEADAPVSDAPEEPPGGTRSAVLGRADRHRRSREGNRRPQQGRPYAVTPTLSDDAIRILLHGPDIIDQHPEAAMAAEVAAEFSKAMRAKTAYLPLTDGSPRLGGSAGAGSPARGDTTITVNVYPTGGDPQVIGQATASAIQEMQGIIAPGPAQMAIM